MMRFPWRTDTLLLFMPSTGAYAVFAADFFSAHRAFAASDIFFRPADHQQYAFHG
jgi:hypothetical protein